MAPRLIFPCSGGSDVGALADQAARKLTDEGVGRMYCLAGIGGRVPGIMKTTEATDQVLVIDGCPLNCARKCLEEAGFTKFKHIRLADIGLIKGQSPANSQNIEIVCRNARNEFT